MKIYKLVILTQKLKDDFDNYLKSIDDLIDIGTDVSNIIIESLKNLNKEYTSIPGFIQFKEKLERNIEMAENIKSHPLLKEKYQIIYNQALVLIVSAFESFMANLLARLINDFPEKVIWPEKKTIGINLNLLKYYSSVGDLILKSLKGEPNFQDWQSISRFLKESLKINIEKDISLGEREKIILYQAIRHIIIHNSSIIDTDFLKQIRDTKIFSEYENKKDNKIEIKESDYKEAKMLFSKVVKLVTEKISL